MKDFFTGIISMGKNGANFVTGSQQGFNTEASHIVDRQKRRFSLFIFLAGWTDNLLTNKMAGAGEGIGVDPADIFTE